MKRLLKKGDGILQNLNSSKYSVYVGSSEWIQIQDDAKNAENSQDIDDILYGTINDRTIVIKFGGLEKSKHEYEIANLIKTCNGFVNYYSSFTCSNDLSVLFGEKAKRNVILMPYYNMGSLADFTWTSKNLLTLHSCLYASCLAYIDAFLEKRFIHKKFHAGNIMLIGTNKHNHIYSKGIKVPIYSIEPLICDFEDSIIGDGNPIEYENFKYDLGKLFLMLPSFVPNIDLSRILNMATFIQITPDICSEDARRQLGDAISANIRLL